MHPGSPLARRLTLVAMCLSQGMILLDITIVNIALPSMQRELHMSPGRLEWVISAYALTLATLIPIGGTLGDRLGRKRIFLLGLLVFTVASVGCALSRTDLVLIGFRVLQGVGGAVMSALTLSILSETYAAERRAGAIGIWAAVAGLGFGAGPIVGGLLLSTFDWDSIFWVNVPVGIIGVLVTVIGVAESRDPVQRPIDGLGVALSAVGLFGVTLALIESSSQSWTSTLVLTPLVGGLACLALFALWERRARHPMVPPALVKTPSFRWSCVVYLLSYATLTGVMFYVTLLFQDVKDWSALRTGLSWLAMNIPFLLIAQFAGRLHRRFSSGSIMAVGLLLAAVGIFELSRVNDTTPFVLAGTGYALLGFGYGMLAPAVTNLAMSRVPLGSSGVASGVLNASRQVGTSVGLAVFGSIGVALSVDRWSQHVSKLPAAQRGVAHSLGQAVAGGQISSVRTRLGSSATEPAIGAFVHGYAVAVGLAAVLLVGAALLAVVGSRAPREPEPPPGSADSLVPTGAPSLGHQPTA